MTAMLLILVFALFATASAECQTSDLKWKFEPEIKDSSLDAFVIANGFMRPRGIQWAHDTLFVVDRGRGIISLVEDTTDPTCNGWAAKVVIDNPDFSHGLHINGTQLYASTFDRVLRYQWDPTSQTVSQEEVLVTGMDLAEDHKTRTLELTGEWLIVAGGSSTNLEAEARDPTHGTAQVRRFALDSSMPTGGWDWFQGELVAYGMRNAVGIVLNSDGTRLYTVENSADNVHYASAGELVDIHNDNPAEELNIVDMSDIGHFYGYPECFTTWDMTEVIPSVNLYTGSQFSIASNVTDAQCANSTYNIPPRLSMQAHVAPLDITFYDAPLSSDIAVNMDYDGDAFVSFHGSWNRDPPVGYGIIRIPFSGREPEAAADSKDGYSYILQAPDMGKCGSSRSCIRPVGLAFDGQGRLFGSSDATGEIFVIQAPGHRNEAVSSARPSVAWGVATLGLLLLRLLA